MTPARITERPRRWTALSSMWNFSRHAVWPSYGPLIALPHRNTVAARCVPPTNTRIGSAPSCHMPTAAVITP